MLKQLEGKPFTISLHGKSRVIGTIAGATVEANRTALMVAVTLTDEEVAGILGAAQDKAEAAQSPIGLSDSEVQEVLNG